MIKLEHLGNTPVALLQQVNHTAMLLIFYCNALLISIRHVILVFLLQSKGPVYGHHGQEGKTEQTPSRGDPE